MPVVCAKRCPNVSDFGRLCLQFATALTKCKVINNAWPKRAGLYRYFYDKSTDSNLSVLFAFFSLADKIKSALLMQKQAF